MVTPLAARWIAVLGLVCSSAVASAQPAPVVEPTPARPSAMAAAGLLTAGATVRPSAPAAGPLRPFSPVQERDYATAYRELTSRRPHYLRAAIELGLALCGGTSWYWLDRERQVADWDYPSWKDRLTFQAWRFDNNPFGINFIWHAINGTSFHLLARSNDLGLLGAVGYGVATSMAWEYLLEFREKISINDVLVTPGSGVAMGEFFFWLGRYLASPNHHLGAAGRAARWSAGLPQAFHDRIDGRLDGPTRSAAPDADSLGFRTDIHHHFAMSFGVGAVASTRQVAGVDADQSRWLSRLDFAGRLVALPGYLRPGDFAAWFGQGNVTALDLSIAGGTEDSGVDLLADTILVGHHRQHITAGQGGHALTLGTSISYQYRRQELGVFHDRLGILHLPGLAVDGVMVGRSWQLLGFARFHGDFAGLGAMAYDAWRATHPDGIDKTVLDRYGYYYGWGFSGRLGGELRTAHLVLGGQLQLGRYFSQEGLDRNQEEVTIDVTASDRVLRGAAWLRVMPFGGRLTLELRYGHQGRWGHVGGVEGREAAKFLSVGVGATL